MKMIPITLQIPDTIDAVYSGMAKREMVSKSAVIRRVLVNHVQNQKTKSKAVLTAAK